MYNTLPAALLVEEWKSRQQISISQAEAALALSESPASSRFISALSFVGALVSMQFFLSFLVMLRLVDFKTPVTLGLWGAAFTIGALAYVHRKKTQADRFSGTFSWQFALMLLLVGKVCLFWFLVKWLGWSALSNYFFASLALTLLTYPFSPFDTDRYLSVLATLIWGFATIGFSHYFADYRWQVSPSKQWAMALYYVLLLAMTAWFFARPHFPVVLKPLRDALLTSLLLIVMLLAASNYFAFTYAPVNGFVTFSLTACLLTITVWQGGGWQAFLRSEKLWMAAVGIIALACVAEAGILLALGFLSLGYACHDRRLLFYGAGFFVGFLILFYYQLQMTLLDKSITLATSGIVLLLGAFYLHRHPAQEVNHE